MSSSRKRAFQAAQSTWENLAPPDEAEDGEDEDQHESDDGPEDFEVDADDFAADRACDRYERDMDARASK